MIEERLRKPNAIKKELYLQWKGVIKRNPLVTASYLMQKAEFVSAVLQELSPFSLDAAFIFDSTEELIRAFPDNDSLRSIAVRFTKCLNRLDRDLGRAKSDAEIRASFERFGRCWIGEE